MTINADQDKQSDKDRRELLERALIRAEEAAESEPKEPMRWFTLAVLYAHFERREDYQRAWDTAYGLDPKNMRGLLRMLNSRVGTPEFTELIDHVEKFQRALEEENA